MRTLCLKDSAFVWTHEMTEEMDKMKEILCSPQHIQPFDNDPLVKTELFVDTSMLNGVGYILTQLRGEGDQQKRVIIRCGSTSARKNWKNLSPIEGEAVGLFWAIKHIDHYVRGAVSTTVVVDHQPLVGLFAGPLQNLSNRLFKIRQELLDYNLVLRWEPG